jgi:hypothetical protein
VRVDEVPFGFPSVTPHMAKIPQSLLYLTIYNPTLRPAHDNPSNDEDAEEQAHILFYTARERAVSRDRMLRQVGLAKALVNFSSLVPSTGELFCHSKVGLPYV